jgi:ubiquinone/menaquinone biosynthesis C-methylase UbiE
MDIDLYWEYAAAVAASRGPAWRYDESKPCGVNYHRSALARRYDSRHGMFRNYREEARQIIAALDLEPADTVIDMGCGTGAFALHAAERCRRLYAVDVSKAMLRRARRKARRAGLTNIEFLQAGFLTYEHKAEPADVAVSVAVLHHLPDFWKAVGLSRLASMLKPGGRFYLFDVVFSFDPSQYESALPRFVEALGGRLGPEGRAESQIHASREYSTCRWIMEGLLQRAGFEIDDVNYSNEFLAGYLCTKKVPSAAVEPLTAATQPLR